MKNWKKLLAVLLAIGMLVSVAACGTASSETVSSAESAVTSSSNQESAPTPDDTAGIPDDSAAEVDAAPAADASAEETSSKDRYVYNLPLTTDDVTLSVLVRFQPFLAQHNVESYDEHVAFIEYQERTGVDLDFVTMSDNEAIITQIALMAASGDYYDLLFNLDTYYVGGVAKALLDDVILDITDIVEEYAPCYMSYLEENEGYQSIAYNDEGWIGCIYGLNNITFARNGNMIRQDWLDSLNLEAPSTISEWHDVLAVFKDAYGITDPYYLPPTGQGETNTLIGCFGSAGLNNFYQEDKTVKSGLIDDGFKAYLETMNQWFNEGLIGSDFYARPVNSSFRDAEELALNSQCGIIYAQADAIENFGIQNVDPNARFVGLVEPTADDGSINQFDDYPSYKSDDQISISAQCEHPELAIQMIDYLYSDEGVLLCNYGLEGESFEYDDNGEPQWTELMTDNPELDSAQQCRVLYTLICMPSVYNMERTWFNQTEDQINSMTDKWIFGHEKSMPPVSLNTEETDQYNAFINDIETYCSETVVKFIIGDKSFDEWDDYVSTVESMNLQACVDAYQSALDRYYTR